jgi:small-conductance mechanosensitive channel
MAEKPKQPAVHVAQPPRQDTKTVESNDPVTNEAERRIAQDELTGPDEERARAEQQAQEEEAKRQQELADQRRTLMQDILKSNEGYVVREEGNQEALEDARTQGLVHAYTVQSGPGGLEVEERYAVSDKGYSSLREVFGENLGVARR